MIPVSGFSLDGPHEVLLLGDEVEGVDDRRAEDPEPQHEADHLAEVPDEDGRRRTGAGPNPNEKVRSTTRMNGVQRNSQAGRSRP